MFFPIIAQHRKNPPGTEEKYWRVSPTTRLVVAGAAAMVIEAEAIVSEVFVVLRRLFNAHAC